MIEKELAKIIIERYYLDVLSFCISKMNDYSDAEDCAQETFVKFLSKREKLDFSDQILIWLLKTADKTIKEFNRKKSEKHYDISEYADVIPDDKGNGIRPISMIYENLPTEDASLFIEYIYCKTRDERSRLADKYKMSLGALYTKITRIKKKLLESLRGSEY